MVTTVLRFNPIYQKRVWGGQRLSHAYGRSTPTDTPIGESWEVVDRLEAQSVVAEGPYSGRTLNELVEGGQLLGPQWPRGRRFPILVKLLDCSERLSLQVHPPADVADLLGGEPKTENWYVMEARAGAGLILGLRTDCSRGLFAEGLRSQNVDACVHRHRVNAGDSVLVHSGQVHAIDAGCVILEIQQNSDTTYRVSDWGRMGLDGKPRQMHLPEALASIDWGSVPPTIVAGRRIDAVIAECVEFRITRVALDAGQELLLGAKEQARLVSLVDGKVLCNETDCRVGETLVLGYDVCARIVARQPSILLVTDRFTNHGK